MALACFGSMPVCVATWVASDALVKVSFSGLSIAAVATAFFAGAAIGAADLVAAFLAAGARAYSGEPGILPVDADWDATFVQQLQSGNPWKLDAVTTKEGHEKTGRGATEGFAWVAAF